MSVRILLHNVRSAHNVGSIFRTADAAGVEHIYLSGYTPTPIDRFGRPQKEVAKTALGAEKTILWTYSKTPNQFLKTLKDKEWRIVGVEIDPHSKHYRTLDTSKSTLFIFGNEVRGISPELRAQCDDLVQIPMRGKKESLNVSVTAGIILFGFVD